MYFNILKPESFVQYMIANLVFFALLQFLNYLFLPMQMSYEILIGFLPVVATVVLAYMSTNWYVHSLLQRGYLMGGALLGVCLSASITMTLMEVFNAFAIVYGAYYE